MGYTHLNHEDVDPVAGELRFLREPLDCAKLGFSTRRLAPGEEGKEHAHDDGQEEVYFVVEGGLTATVDGDTLELGAGDALRVAPETTRQLVNGDEESFIVIASAP